MSTVGQQVIVGVAAGDLLQTLANLTVKESHDLADALEGESLAPEFADHRHFGEVIHGIETAMALALRLDHAAFVPPLELARGDAGQRNHLLRCEAALHGRLK